MPWRKRARTMPSQRRCTNPVGQTSTSFAMKSVSGAEDDAYKSTRIGPVTSISSASGSVT